MNIIIERTRSKKHCVEGHLYIDGTLVCDTLENSSSCLAPGIYCLKFVKCKQYRRKMICIEKAPETSEHASPELASGSFGPMCHKCKLKELVFNNTVMPQFCPQIKAGNGVHGRRDGSIIVGTRATFGCIISPRSAFDLLYERIRKNIERGKHVSLEIR